MLASISAADPVFCTGMLMGLVIILLILANAGFVIVEMALVSSRPARLEARAVAGDRGAKAALWLLKSPTLYLSTVQVGITGIGIMIGAFGEEALANTLAQWITTTQPALEPYAHAIGLAATVATLTFVIIVVAELVPKRLAQTAPELFARLGSRPMVLMARICRPFIWLLSFSTDLVLKIIPLRARQAAGREVQQEIKAIIASGARTGTVHATEQHIVERVFRLGEQSVKAVMVPRTDIDFLLIDDSEQRIRVVIAAGSHSYLPVCRTGLDDLVGVVHVKDLVKASLIMVDGENRFNLAELVRPPVFVPESTPAIQMLETFKREKTHIAFVLDEYGVLEGLVTLNDVLEALVGEVSRAGDIEEPAIVKRADGSFLLDGMLAVGELKELLGVQTLPKEDLAGYETLGGLVMTYLGRIPATGDAFAWDRFKFEVVDMDKARVDKVLLIIGPKRTDAGDNPEGE